MGFTIAWLMSLPSAMSLDDFENWYLTEHAEVARRLPKLRRYAVHRLVDSVEQEDRTGVYRIAQLVWDSREEAEAAFNAVEGYATFGDGAVNTPGAHYVEALALTDDHAIDVARPASFDLMAGRFRSGDDGQLYKLMTYGTGDPPTEQTLLERYSRIAQDSRVRGHVLGRPAGCEIGVGRITVPSSGQKRHDWSWELWFDDLATARDVGQSADFQSAWREITASCGQPYLAIHRSQELFCSVPAAVPGS